MLNFIILLLALGPLYGAVVLDEKKLEELTLLSPSYQSINERLLSAERLKGSLQRSFLPKINLHYGREIYTTGPYHQVNQPFGGIEAKINIFNSGKDELENSKRDKEAEIAKIQTQLTSASLMSEIRKAMAHYAYLREIKEILKEALLQNESQIKGAERRISAGLGTKTDLLDFRQQEIEFNQELLSLQYEQEMTLRLVKTLIGEEEENVKIVFDNLHEHSDEELKIKEAMPSLVFKMASLRAQVAGIESSISKRWWMPSLDVYSYALRFTQKEREYDSPGERNDVGFGFRFNLPLFDGGENHRLSQAKGALALSREHETQKRRLEFERDRENTLEKLKLAHSLIHGAEESVKVMTDYRRGILNEYGRGIKNSPDVLQALGRWIEAKTRYAEVKKNYQFAKSEAMYFMKLQEH